MGRSTTLVIATALFLLYITGLATLSSRSKTESTLYIDDLTVTLDKQNLYELYFTEKTQHRLQTGDPAYETMVSGAHVGTTDYVVYTGDEYASPPMSLGFLAGAEYGVGLVIKDNLPAEWDELRVSYLMKGTGAPPSTLSCMVRFDYSSGIIWYNLGEKDYLTGASLWDVYEGGVNADASHQSMMGSVPWDWGAWHSIEMAFSRSLHSFSLILDGDVLYSGRFDPRLSSVLVIEMRKN